MIDLIRRRIVPTVGMMALAVLCGAAAPSSQGEPFVVSTVLTGLDTPWDLAWGPDGFIWFSERGGRISRLDPATGTRTTAGTLACTRAARAA